MNTITGSELEGTVITVQADGRTTEWWPGRRLELAELRAAVGGGWSIEGEGRLPDGRRVYVIAATGAYLRGEAQNGAASRMCGRMVWGTAAYVIRGEEMA